MARKKINVGDWCITPFGSVIEVGFVATSYTYVSDLHTSSQYDPAELRLLPASPATLAKSHRLLTRWCRADDIEYRYGYPPEWIKARKDAKAHCRRIAKGKGMKK